MKCLGQGWTYRREVSLGSNNHCYSYRGEEGNRCHAGELSLSLHKIGQEEVSPPIFPKTKRSRGRRASLLAPVGESLALKRQEGLKSVFPKPASGGLMSAFPSFSDCFPRVTILEMFAAAKQSC